MLKTSRSLMLILVPVLSCIGITESAAKSDTSEKIGASVFWIVTGNNQLFDWQVTRFIASHAGVVVLNIPVDTSDNTYSYSAIVSRLHAENSRLPVLLYSWGTVFYPKEGTVGSEIGNGVLSVPNALMRLGNGEPITSPRRDNFWLDPGSPQYRNWFIKRVESYLGMTGANGIALDMMFHTPSFIVPSCKVGAKACDNYRQGMHLLLSGMHRTLKENWLIYNGIWNEKPGMLEDQQQLLQFADGAAIEFFGQNQTDSKAPSFETGIAPYLKAITAFPQKKFFVFGRGPMRYTDYATDYQWQRYLYCAYLLVASPLTYFHYLTTFEVPSAGRADGLSWYRDWDMELGQPEGPYQQSGDVYFRHFANGLVLFSPASGRGGKFRLDGSWYTPEGVSRSGVLAISPGSGVLLMRSPPPSRGQQMILGAGNIPSVQWPAAAAKKEGTSNYLALSVLPSVNAWQHDFLLDPEHDLAAPQCVHLIMRSKDANLRLALVAAVDDQKRQDEQAAVEYAVPGSHGDDIVPIFGFRVTKPVKGVPRQPGIQALPPADGRWHELSVCGDRVFNGRYRFEQWKFLRISGAVDIRNLSLTSVP